MNNCWNFPITQSNYRLYALSNYNNGKGTWNSFFSDIKLLHFTIKCLSSRINGSQKISSKIIVNTIIKLGNVFKGQSLSRLLFSTSSKEVHSELKTFLTYTHRLPEKIPETNLEEIVLSEELLQELIDI